jgi:hypothetical protein
MKKLLLSFFATFALVTGYSQTVEELKAEQAPKKDSIAAIQARINALQSKIDGMPGWKKGAFGGSSQKVVGFYDQAKIVVSLYRKNSTFLTPLNCALKAFIFALNDSAEALVLLLSK